MSTTSPSPLGERGPVFQRELRGNTLVLRPLGPLGNFLEPEINAETLELLSVINHSGPTNLVIDLQQGSYFGTALLGAFVRIWKRVAQRGGRLALCNVSEMVSQVLRITKLQTVWPIHGTLDEALRAVGVTAG